jgi:hypothetical protein
MWVRMRRGDGDEGARNDKVPTRRCRCGAADITCLQTDSMANGRSTLTVQSTVPAWAWELPASSSLAGLRSHCCKA